MADSLSQDTIVPDTSIPDVHHGQYCCAPAPPLLAPWQLGPLTRQLEEGGLGLQVNILVYTQH